MSGREDTSEPTGTAGSPTAVSPGAPSHAVPPSFGQFAHPQAATGGPESEEEQETSPPAVSLGPPPFGPNTPWWAEPRDGPAQATEEPATDSVENGEEPALPPGTLVAGVGVPSIDTRRAVPMEPIQESNLPNFPDTDPDGIPMVTPQAEPAEAQPDPAPTAAESPLTPDAILPPGVSPAQHAGLVRLPEPPEPPPSTGHQARTEEAPAPPPGPTAPPAPPGPSGQPFPPGQPGQPVPQVITPLYHPDGAGIPPTGSPPGRTSRSDRNRRTLMIGGVIAAAILIPAAVFAAFGLSSDAKNTKQGAADRPAKPNASTPPAKPATPPAKPPVNIETEATDRKPLSLPEAFPDQQFNLGGRLYLLDKTSVNHQCSLAASGVMIAALDDANCRSVVRVTYVNRIKTVAVTAGIAVMPNRKAAQKVSQAGDPSSYEWFRGMPGKRSRNIDQVGGYASSTVRGRYVIYVYATYSDGTAPKQGDGTLKDVAGQFLGVGVRPIAARANGS